MFAADPYGRSGGRARASSRFRFDTRRAPRPNRGASMLPPVLFVPPKDAQRRQSIDGPYLVTISSKKVLAAPSRDRLRNCARPPCPFRTTAAAAGRCHRLARVWLCLDCAAPAPSNAQVQMPPTRAGLLAGRRVLTNHEYQGHRKSEVGSGEGQKADEMAPFGFRVNNRFCVEEPRTHPPRGPPCSIGTVYGRERVGFAKGRKFAVDPSGDPAADF